MTRETGTSKRRAGAKAAWLEQRGMGGVPERESDSERSVGVLHAGNRELSKSDIEQDIGGCR